MEPEISFFSWVIEVGSLRHDVNVLAYLVIQTLMGVWEAVVGINWQIRLLTATTRLVPEGQLTLLSEQPRMRVALNQP